MQTRVGGRIATTQNMHLPSIHPKGVHCSGPGAQVVVAVMEGSHDHTHAFLLDRFFFIAVTVFVAAVLAFVLSQVRWLPR